MSVIEERESYAISRQHGLGGTDMAAILGLSPWKRPIDIYAGKVDPGSQPELDKECLFWGTALEPIIRKRYAMRFGVDVMGPAEIRDVFPLTTPWRDQTIVFGREPWMLGTPDGFIRSVNSGLEVKCSSRHSEEWGTEGSDEVPAHYLIQAAWYAAVTEAAGWNFAVLFSGSNLQQFRVVRDLELERELIAAGRSFWFDYVEKQIEPPIDESESYGKYLAQKFSLNKGEVISQPSQEILDWTAEMLRASEDCKDAENRERLANNTLRALIGDAQKAITPFGAVGWVRPKPSHRTDWKSVSEELTPSAEMIAAHTVETQTSAYLRGWWKKEK